MAAVIALILHPVISHPSSRLLCHCPAEHTTLSIPNIHRLVVSVEGESGRVRERWRETVSRVSVRMRERLREIERKREFERMRE